jgi:hypothetical protein
VKNGIEDIMSIYGEVHFVPLLGGLNIFHVKHILIEVKWRSGITPNVIGLGEVAEPEAK